MRIGNWEIEYAHKTYYIYRKWDYPDSDARHMEWSLIKALFWCITRE